MDAMQNWMFQFMMNAAPVKMYMDGSEEQAMLMRDNLRNAADGRMLEMFKMTPEPMPDTMTAGG